MKGLPNKKQFEEAGAELAIAPAMVEKDWQMTRVQALISTLNLSGYQIIFSGGTSLSKAYGLIKRFSEDIDLKVIPEETDPNRATLSVFKNSIINVFEADGFALNRNSLIARDNNRFFSFNINYHSYFTSISGLRPHIQLEFTISRPVLPSTKSTISSFINQIKKDAPEVSGISCIDPVEIAADKLSALVWRIPKYSQEKKQEDRSLVRHIHDLAMLESIVKNNDLFPILVLTALEKDNERNKEISKLNSKEKFSLLVDTLANNIDRYRTEYDFFVSSVSYAIEDAAPDYETAVNAVKQLITVVVSS